MQKDAPLIIMQTDLTRQEKSERERTKISDQECSKDSLNAKSGPICNNHKRMGRSGRRHSVQVDGEFVQHLLSLLQLEFLTVVCDGLIFSMKITQQQLVVVAAAVVVYPPMLLPQCPSLVSLLLWSFMARLPLPPMTAAKCSRNASLSLSLTLFNTHHPLPSLPPTKNLPASAKYRRQNKEGQTRE